MTYAWSDGTVRFVCRYMHLGQRNDPITCRITLLLALILTVRAVVDATMGLRDWQTNPECLESGSW